MKRFLSFFCALLCLLSLVACQETREDGGSAATESEPFRVTMPEWRQISIWHYPTGEREEDGVVYSDAFNKIYFEEMVAVIEGSAFAPDPDAEFDSTEYYDINFIQKGSMAQYALSVSVNGVVDIERKKCRVSEGAFSFERVKAYFEAIKNLPEEPSGS